MIPQGDLERDPLRKRVVALMQKACPDSPEPFLGHAADGLTLGLIDDFEGMETLPGFLEIAVGRWLATVEGLPSAREWITTVDMEEGPLRIHADALFSMRSAFREACLLLVSGVLRWDANSPWHASGAWECDVRSMLGTSGLFDLEQAAVARPLGRVLVELSRTGKIPFAVILRGPLQTAELSSLADGIKGAFFREALVPPALVCRPSASPWQRTG